MAEQLIKSTRTENTIKNSILSVVSKLVHLILTFISRKIFIMMLGSIYLGINSLFTSILSVLSIAELGFGTAICFTMFKPFAENDSEKVNMYLNYYKKIYRVIGFIIFLIGLCFIPFLSYLLNGVEYTFEIGIIFILYLIQTCSSYWALEYRSVLFTASQSQHRIEKFNIIYSILLFAFQVSVLYLTKNFIAYLIVGILLQLAKNIIVGLYAKKEFPFIKNKTHLALTKTEKRELYKNVTGLACYKVSGTVYSSSDSIIISAFVSTVILGLYTNYATIISALVLFVNTIIGGCRSSVGNLYVSAGETSQKKVFDSINLINFWLYSVVTVCIWCLISPFVGLFYGQEYILSDYLVFWIVLNLCSDGLGAPITLYKDACGLFWKGKFRPLFSTIVNIVVSIILVKPFGIVGVLMGTIVSRFCVFLWYDTRLVFKNVFKTNWWTFILKYFVELLAIMALGYGTTFIWLLFPSVNWWSWLAVGCVAFAGVNLLYLLVFWRNSKFQFLKTKFVKFFKQPVRAILLKFKKIGQKLHRKKVLFLCSISKTMDEHIVHFYKKIESRKFKVRLVCFDLRGYNVAVDSKRAKNLKSINGFHKLKIIKSKIKYLLSNPDIMVFADLYIPYESLFISKKIMIEHGTATLTDGVSNRTYGTGKYAYDENGNIKFDKIFCYTKPAYDYILETQPDMNGVIEFVGIDLAETIVPRLTERDKYREQFGFKNSDKVVFMIGSWNSDSFFQSLGKEVIYKAKDIMNKLPNIKFILSIHPNEYTQYNEKIESMGAFIDSQETNGFVVRHPGDDITPFIAASDMVMGDFSSAMELAILAEKPIAYSNFDESKLLPCALSMVLKKDVPILYTADDVEKVIMQDYSNEIIEKIKLLKSSIYLGQDFYGQRINEIIDKLLK